LSKLGLIAGNGKFPVIFAQEAKRQGFTVVAVGHRGETLEELNNVVDEIAWIYVGQLGKAIRTFRRAGVSEAVMAGGIRKAKLFGNFRPDLRGAKFLARVRGRDDDSLLRGVADEFEAEGIRILESTLCLSRILATEGVLTRLRPASAQWEDVHFGFRVAKEIGRMGIGQTVIVKGRVVVAVEALEGTDAAIQRGGELARSGCVVVKVSKPNQDLRFDVPAVGIGTITAMKSVGGAVLALEAGKTILLERDELLNQADAAGISVVGLS
jgi:DUF1009 family protein